MLVPGWHEADVELLGEESSGFVVTTSVVSVMGEDAGYIEAGVPDGGEVMAGWLQLRWPRSRRIEVVRRHTGAGPRHLLVCPACGCGRVVRKLFMPRTAPGTTRDWGCRTCTGFIYVDTRPHRDLYSDTLERYDDLVALQHDLQRLRQGMLDRLDTD
jgi:hypothetical protein